MNKRFTTKGAGWLPDDIASIIFALLLILVAFVIFGKVNELVANRNTQEVIALHESNAQQQLLRIVLASPLIIDGEEKTTAEFIADYMVISYLLNKNPSDTDLKTKQNILKKDLLGDPILNQLTIEYLLNEYQPAQPSANMNFLSLRMRQVSSSLFTISLVDINSQQKTNPIFYSHGMPLLASKKASLMKERPVQATAYIPIPPKYFQHLKNHVIIFEIYEPTKTTTSRSIVT